MTGLIITLSFTVKLLCTDVDSNCMDRPIFVERHGIKYHAAP